MKHKRNRFQFHPVSSLEIQHGCLYGDGKNQQQVSARNPQRLFSERGTWYETSPQNKQARASSNRKPKFNDKARRQPCKSLRLGCSVSQIQFGPTLFS